MVKDSDFGSLARMFRELQSFHGHSLDTLESLQEQLMHLPRQFDLIVAEQGPSLLGFALLATIPGPALRPGIFLKELFVTDASRGLGVGRRLMQAVARLAIERGCARIDLTTHVDYARTRSFYEQLGGKHDRERVFYRFGADAIVSMAQDEAPDERSSCEPVIEKPVDPA